MGRIDKLNRDQRYKVTESAKEAYKMLDYDAEYAEGRIHKWSDRKIGAGT
jgi:hypothetical protein